MAQVTINTGTADGTIYASNATYSTARNAASGDVVTTNLTKVNPNSATVAYLIERGFFAFDLSSILSGSTVTAATFSLAGTGDATVNADSSSIGVVESTQTAEIIVAGDYSKFNTTELASRITNANWVTTNNTYNDFVLNASGIAIVQTAVGGAGFVGFAKFCTRSGKNDIDNTAPTGSNYVTAYASDNGSSKPQLVVTYTLPSSGSFLMNFT